MGSYSTKVARSAPHVKAAASPVAPTQQHHQKSNKANEPEHCQDYAPDLEAAQATFTTPPAFDDTYLKASTQTTTISRRRYSEPAQPALMATETNMDGARHLDAFEGFVAERNLMSIDIDYASLIHPMPVEQLSVPITPPPIPKNPQEPEVQCIGCCAELPREKDPKHAREVVKPCRSCNSAYCVPCVKDMFLKACEDSTRMPPRCCVQIHLHHVKPYLSVEEVTEYKSKYEEWSTLKPFYCPIPTCSVFIPERLLPQQVRAKGKRKADSGIGTPTSPNFACPKCEGEICVDCRQTVHPGSLCAPLDLGVDAETAALLKAWGYKRCPKCSQGLKRMYGCNHMECRCGAHFCWGCMKSRDECGGGCNEDDDDDYSSDSEPDELEPLPGRAEDTETIAVEEQTMTTERSEAAIGGLMPVAGNETTTPQRPSRPRNLDGGSAQYWEEQDLYFGHEPSDDIQDRTWDCDHSFEPYTIPFASSLTQHPSSNEVECVKCWCAIRPELETPRKPIDAPAKTSSSNSTTRSGVPRRHGPRERGIPNRGRHFSAARLRPTGYTPPRGLFRHDATIGTAPHLIASLSPLRTRTATTRPEPMEDIQSQADPDATIKLPNTGYTSSTSPNKKGESTPATSEVFAITSPTYTVAQECHICSLLVCKKCADDILAQRQAEEEQKEAEREADESDAEAEAAEEPRSPSDVPAPASPDSDDEQAPPSLFD